MRLPAAQKLKELVGWQPADGVLSVYVAVDPADRSAAWRVELTDRLRDALGSEDPRSGQALRATAERAQETFPECGSPPSGRGQIGFLEVARKPGRELWYASQIPPRRTEAVYGHRSYLRPLIEILDDGARIGVAAVSSERVRLWECELGSTRQAGEWELGAFFGDWRERKAQQPADPARMSGASAAGHDQHRQRMGAERERFLKEIAAKTAGARADRGWRELLVLGENEAGHDFRHALGTNDFRWAADKNVIHEEAHEIAERIAKLLPAINRDREMKLVALVKDSAYAGKARGSLGPQETLEALNEGRVEHLLFDADRDYRGHGIEEGLAYAGPPVGDGGLPVAELLIERALETGARITPLVGDAAAALEEHGGVAALLRY